MEFKELMNENVDIQYKQVFIKKMFTNVEKDFFKIP